MQCLNVELGTTSTFSLVIFIPTIPTTNYHCYKIYVFLLPLLLSQCTYNKLHVHSTFDSSRYTFISALFTLYSQWQTLHETHKQDNCVVADSRGVHVVHVIESDLEHLECVELESDSEAKQCCTPVLE
jgi:hypothetical protein